MSSLMRSAQYISQVLRNKAARVGFAPSFYTGLMRAVKEKKLADQSVAPAHADRLMTAARFNPQGLRYTLR